MAIFNKILFRKKDRLLTGFTLIEILVAVSIFVSAVTVASTIFVSALRAQRQSLAYYQLLGQTSYLLEYMTNAIRHARKDDTPGAGGEAPISCLSGDRVNFEFINSCLMFQNSRRECQEFCLRGERLTERIRGRTEYDLTSPNLRVLSFTVAGSESWQQPSNPPDPGDFLQPMVIISLNIQGEEQSEIEIETSVSQKVFDDWK